MSTATRSARATRAGSSSKEGGNQFTFGQDPSENLSKLAASPTKHKLAVMPHNIGKGTQGCYAGMTQFQERTGANPSDITLPTEVQAGAATAVAEEMEDRKKYATEFYGAMKTVAQADAHIYQEWAKAQTTRMQSTLEQSEASAAMAVAGIHTHTKYQKLARRITKEVNYNNSYNKTHQNLMGKNITAARVG